MWFLYWAHKVHGVGGITKSNKLNSTPPFSSYSTLQAWLSLNAGPVLATGHCTPLLVGLVEL